MLNAPLLTAAIDAFKISDLRRPAPGPGTDPQTPFGESIQEVVVARYQGQPEAEMWAELLRNEGIPTAVIQLLPGARPAWGMVPCELRVRSTDLERARSVLGLEL